MEADQFGLILLMWLDDRPPMPTSRPLEGEILALLSRIVLVVERGSSAMCDTQRVLGAKRFSKYLFLVVTLVVPYASACCRTPGLWSLGDESHSLSLDNQYRH